MAGIDEFGFSKKTLDQIRESLRNRAIAKFGPTVNTSEDSVLGGLIDVQAEEIAASWSGLEGVYNGFNPSTDEGVPQDNNAELVGIQRLSAAFSTTTTIVTGDSGVTVVAGSLISVNTTGSQFSNLLDKSLTLADPTEITVNIDTVVDSTVYTIIINSTIITYTSDSSATLNEITVGLENAVNISAENGNVTALDNGNGTVTVSSDIQIGATSLIPVPFLIAIDLNMSAGKISTRLPVIATVTGEISAPASNLVNIDTPIFGWDSVTNPDDVTLGREVESDASFRQRRFESVQIAGAGTVPAIEANIRQVNGVTDAFVIENRSISTDADGRPGKSFEPIVQGGIDQEVAQELWDIKPAGIETYGSTSLNVTDSQGNSQSVSFSRPTIIWIHLEIDYTVYSEEVFPDNGEDTMKQVTADSGNSLGIGEDVLLQRFFGDIYGNVNGISSLVIRQATSSTELGAPGSFSTSNLSIDPTELSNFNISRITVAEV